MSNVRLTNEAGAALSEVAGYLRTVRKGSDRKHYQNIGPEGLGKELVGFWQTEEWIDGLLALADEAERVSRL